MNRPTTNAILLALLAILATACAPTDSIPTPQQPEPAGTSTSGSRVEGRIAHKPTVTPVRVAQVEEAHDPAGTPTSRGGVTSLTSHQTARPLTPSGQTYFPMVFRRQGKKQASAPPHEAPRHPSARTAPDFTLQLYDGGQLSLHDLQGKAVILNFWASWCKPCRAEMPAMEEVYEEYQSKGLVVLGVDQGESASEVLKFVTQYGLSFPILLDKRWTVSQAYHMTGLPTTVFVYPNGTILDTVVGGPMSKSFLEGKIRELLRTENK